VIDSRPWLIRCRLDEGEWERGEWERSVFRVNEEFLGTEEEVNQTE